MNRISTQTDLRSAGGSVIVAVLVAMVFIGIVTSFMVKNAMSQSAARAGYGSVMTMHSTASSGMIATESYFADPANKAEALEMLNALWDDPDDDGRYFIGGRGGRAALAGGQFFRSRLAGVYESGSGGEINALVSVDAGRGEYGRALGRALAFYRAAGVKPEYGGGGTFPGQDAFYMAGQFIGDAQFNIKGHATFDGDFQLNTPASFAKFSLDDKGNGDVAFRGGTTRFNTTHMTFEGNAYFENYTEFGSQFVNTELPMFRKSAGFNGNVSSLNTSTVVEFGKDVWINGSFKNHSGQYSSQTYMGGSGKFNYYDGGSGFIYIKSTPQCSDHSQTCIHGVPPWEHVGGSSNTKAVKPFEDGNRMVAHSSKIDVMQKLGMARAPEPDLDLNPATNPNLAGKKFFSLQDLLSGPAVPGYPHNTSGAPLNYKLDGPGLEKFISWARTKTDGDGKLVYGDYFYNGHFLVNANSNYAWYGGDFNEKIMFNVTQGNSMFIGGNFYNSGDDASTLIYMAPGAGQLSNMGVSVPGGQFRGLIFTDPKYTGQINFEWADSVNVRGAVILKGGIMNGWRGKSAPIQRDNSVLSAFGGLAGELDPEPQGIVAVDTLIRLKPMGVYFY